MTNDQIQVGTVFIYTGDKYPKHYNVLQTIIKIENGNVYTDIHGEEIHDYKFTFQTNSKYMHQCRVINFTNNIMKKEFIHNNVKFIITLELYVLERTVNTTETHRLRIQEVDGNFYEEKYVNNFNLQYGVQNFIDIATNYVNNHTKEINTLKETLNKLGFQEEREL